MIVEQGLFQHGVLQRTAKNVSDVEVGGACSVAGRVLLRVLKGTKKLKGFDGVAVGEAAQGRFSARLKGIPAGGPYTVELWVVDAAGKIAARVRVADVCVGDLWILAGQSNMEGIGWLEYALKPHPLVRAFYMTDAWAVAKDPLHTLWNAVDPVHASVRNNRPKPPKYQGVGPGLSFGQAMRHRTGVPQGLIACGHGGTSMAQWDPAKLGDGGNSLYGASIRRIQKNGGHVAGVLWYQGESDANASVIGLYTQRMETLIASFRRDAQDPNLPFVLVQLARHIVNDGALHWNSIQEQQRRLPRRVKRCRTVPAIDLDMDDGIHVGGRGMAVLGRRLAEAMDEIRRGAKAGRPPIELKSIAVTTNKVLNTAELRVRFAHVEGGLRAHGEPHGFSLSGGGGVIRTLLKGDTAWVLTGLPVPQAGQYALHYGQGAQPVCNIHDGGGRSLPVFGPAALGKPRAATPYIRSLQVSSLLPSAGNLTGLSYPDIATLELRQRLFDGAFCDVHLETNARAPEDNLLYFRFRFLCAESMQLILWLGYDGPVKAWIDGIEQFHDPNGTNPARVDDATIAFSAAAGAHEALIALATNKGNAWGIYLQMERTDVSAAEIEAGLSLNKLPQIE